MVPARAGRARRPGRAAEAARRRRGKDSGGHNGSSYCHCNSNCHSPAPHRLPPQPHRRGLPRHRKEGDTRPHARPRPHAGRRPQRLRQVQLRRGPRAAAHGRDLPLEGPLESLEGGLPQPPPRADRHPRRSSDRGRDGRLHGRPRVERRRRARSGRGLGGASGPSARQAHLSGLARGAREPPAVPLLQRARLDARRRAVAALRRAREDPRPRRSRRRPGRAAEGTQSTTRAARDRGRGTDVAAQGAAGGIVRRARRSRRAGPSSATTGASTSSSRSWRDPRTGRPTPSSLC